MKPELTDHQDNAGKRKAERVKHQLSVFLICLGISIFLWFLVRLSKDYNVNLKYNIEYRGLPMGMMLTGYSDSTLDLTLRIRGFEYFSEQYFKPSNRLLKVSLRSVRIRQWEDQLRGYMLTKNLVKNFSEQVGYPVEITATSPDTLFFNFQRRTAVRKNPPAATRSIEIKPDRDTAKSHRDSIILIKNQKK